MPDAEGFLGWAAASVPDARGYWPCQAVATYALSGVPAIDTGVTASLGALHTRGHWNADLLGSLGVREDADARRRADGPGRGTLPESDAVITGGTIDALCDQIVAGASQPGDVLVIFGATLIVWAVCDEWLVAPGLISYPHTTPDRFLIGGPVQRRRAVRRLGSAAPAAAPRSRGPTASGSTRGSASPGRVPVWLPYVRGERTPFEDHTLRSNLYGLDIGSGAEALERAAYEASGFVVRRMLDRCRREGHPHRGERWRLARHGLDGRRGGRHQPPRRRRRRARGRCARRRVLRPHGRRARDVAGRLGPLVRRGPTDRAGPGLGAARPTRATRSSARSARARRADGPVHR